MRILSIACLFSSLLLVSGGLSGEKKSESKTFPLWPQGAPGAKGKEPGDTPEVIVYLPAADKANGTAVVICPGGGYGALAMDHEGHQIAKWFNTLGVAGIIVKYRLGPKYHYPAQLDDAQHAIRYTRAHAKEWAIDPNKVGILGFSAGGHLASTAGTRFELERQEVASPIESLSCRPDFMILCYPVIRMTGPYSHGGSRNNLLGKDADPKLAESLDNDTQVTAKTPPTFLLSTSEDTAVPPENSTLFYQALVKNKVPAELHIYEKGRHGLGLGPKDLPYSSWPDRCAAWMKGRGLLGKE